MNHELEKTFLDSVITRLKEYKTLGEKTFLQLKDDEIHFAPNVVSNSIAVIIQHLHGNMVSRWTNFLSEDGEKLWRNRDKEFEILPITKADLMKKWDHGWQVFLETLESLTYHDLFLSVTIRGQPLIVLDAINRQVAHYSYHVGQIVYLGRWIKSDEWNSLSIPKGNSDQFNEEMKKTTQ